MSRPILKLFSLLIFFGVFFQFAQAATIQKQPNNLGLVGYWPMNEGVGNVAGDNSGNKNTLTLSGTTKPAWATGRRGGALSFDGASSYLDLPDSGGNLSVDVTRITISAWINPSSYANGSDHEIIINKENVWEVGLTTGTGSLQGAGASNCWRWAGTPIIPLNTWTHIAVVWDGAAEKHYVNGNLIDNLTDCTTPLTTNTQNMRVGARGGTGAATAFFPGKIDDLRIYNRALSAAEISYLYSSGGIIRKNVSNNGLAGYWSLDDARGLTAGDSSGNKLSGILHGGVSWTTGKRGGALSFDGNSGSYVSIANFPAQGNFTISFWMNPTKCGGAETQVFDSVDDNLGVSCTSARLGSWNTSNYPESAVGTIATSSWVHVAVARGPVTTTIYINGQSSGSAGSSASINSGTAYIGSIFNGTRNFTGVIDDFRIYSRTLSAAEIAALAAQNQTNINHSENSRMTGGLVGLWSFNGPDISGTTAYDRSGLGNNATISGAKPAIGKVGQSLSFDGSSSYVLSPSLGAGSSSVTLSAWIKPNPAGGVVFSELGQAVINNGWHDSEMEVETNNVIKVCMWAGSETCVNAGTGISYGQWYHVVMTYNSSNTTLTGYVNGVQGASTVATKQNTNPVYYGIGSIDSTDGGSTSYFSGLIDEVRIYSTALSAAQINQLYLLGK